MRKKPLGVDEDAYGNILHRVAFTVASVSQAVLDELDAGVVEGDADALFAAHAEALLPVVEQITAGSSWRIIDGDRTFEIDKNGTDLVTRLVFEFFFEPDATIIPDIISDLDNGTVHDVLVDAFADNDAPLSNPTVTQVQAGLFWDITDGNNTYEVSYFAVDGEFTVEAKVEQFTTTSSSAITNDLDAGNIHQDLATEFSNNNWSLFPVVQIIQAGVSWKITDGRRQYLLENQNGDLVVRSQVVAATSILYSGEQTDASGLQYLRARYYDPATGRFNRLDPFAGNNSDPQSLHKYLYTTGDPINLIDPSGRVGIVSQLGNFAVRAHIRTSSIITAALPVLDAAWKVTGIWTAGWLAQAAAEELTLGRTTAFTRRQFDAGMNFMGLLSLGTAAVSVYPRLPSNIREPGGLRWAARQVHSLVGAQRGIQNTTVVVVEAEVQGVRQFYASASGGRLSGPQINRLTSLGIPRQNIFRGPAVTVSDRSQNHAEQIIRRNLPEGARVRRWGISWGFWNSIDDSLPFPCTNCAATVEELGGTIEINQVASPPLF